MNNDTIKMWLYLTTKTEVSKSKLFRLYKYFKSASAICSATGEELREAGVLSEDDINDILNRDFSELDGLMNTLSINSVKVLTIECEEYPELLFTLSDPPLVLYCRGRFIDLNKYVCVASVGTRTPTAYGKKCTYDIVRELSEAGILVVSGMAQGIDAISHMAAIDSGYPTVAFVANGIDVIYPKINAELHRSILKTGMIVSEYPLGTLPKKYYFLERNRLIAGVSKGIFLSEAAIKSGSSATVARAVEQGKDIFALPGNVTSAMSTAPNKLIKDGAYPVTEASDIINHYEAIYNDNMDYGRIFKTTPAVTLINDEILESAPQDDDAIRVPEELSDEEKVTFLLKNSPCDIDTISIYTDISINDLNMILLMMEMNGRIKSDNGKYFLIK